MAEHDEQLVFEMGYNKGFKDGIKGSILKADYENRLKKVANKLRASGQIQEKDRYIRISEVKRQMVAMLTEIQTEIKKHTMTSGVTNQGTWNECIACCNRVIDGKINSLKETNNVDKT